jgi:hypothetical protein
MAGPSLIIQYDSDDEVIEAVRRAVDRQDIEIWDGVRRVALIRVDRERVA